MLTTSDVRAVVGASETLTSTWLVEPFSITSEETSLIGSFCVLSEVGDFSGLSEVIATSTWLVDEATEVSSFFGDSEAGAVELPSLFGVSETEVSETTSLVDVSETGALELSSLFGVSETEDSEKT